MSGAILFEQEYRDRLWRFQLMRREGKDRLHVWAWFRASDGEWRPCKGREVGFVMPIERLSELVVDLIVGSEAHDAVHAALADRVAQTRDAATCGATGAKAATAA